MAESNLTLSFTVVADRVARYLGYPLTSAARSTAQNDDIDRAIKSGYRQFLHPPILPGERSQYEWSFLEPVVTLDTVADQYAYDVPSDFSHLVGAMVLDDSPYLLGGHVPGIDIIGTSELMRLRSLSTSTGTPTKCAYFHSHEDSSAQPQFWLYPTPDKVYQVNYRYRAEPSNPSSAFTGGQVHSETILASVMSCAELQMEETRGAHYQNFFALLAGSISQDRKTGAQFFGYNGDRPTREVYRRIPTINHENS